MTQADAINCDLQEMQIQLQTDLHAAHHQASALEAQLHEQVNACQATQAGAASELASALSELQRAQTQVVHVHMPFSAAGLQAANLALSYLLLMPWTAHIPAATFPAPSCMCQLL